MIFSRSKQKNKKNNLFAVFILVLLTFTIQSCDSSNESSDDLIWIQRDKLVEYNNSLRNNINNLPEDQQSKKEINKFLNFFNRIDDECNLEDDECIIKKQIKQIKDVVDTQTIESLSQNSGSLAANLTNNNTQLIYIKKSELKNILSYADPIPNKLRKKQLDRTIFDNYFKCKEDNPTTLTVNEKTDCDNAKTYTFTFITQDKYVNDLTQLSLSKSYLQGFLDASQNTYNNNNDNYAFGDVTPAWGKWIAKVLSIFALFICPWLFLQFFPTKEFKKLLENLNNETDESYLISGEKPEITNVDATKDSEDYSNVKLTILGKNLDKIKNSNIKIKINNNSLRLSSSDILDNETYQQYGELSYNKFICLVKAEIFTQKNSSEKTSIEILNNEESIHHEEKLSFINIINNLSYGGHRNFNSNTLDNDVLCKFKINNLTSTPTVKAKYTNSDSIKVLTNIYSNQGTENLQVDILDPTNINELIIYPSQDQINFLSIPLNCSEENVPDERHKKYIITLRVCS